jgi:hypothetical protein
VSEACVRVAAMPRFDLGGIGERVNFVLNADKHMAEVVGMLKDTHAVLSKLAGVVDRMEAVIDDVEKRTGGVDQITKRLDRLEEAALNIERATLGVEAAMLSLPRALRTRIARERRPGASDEVEPAETPEN